MKRLLCALFLLTLALPPSRAAALPPMEEVLALEAFFSARKLPGTFVVLDAETGTARGWNAGRAAQRFTPASTFKIANALIGLDAGAVKDVETVLPFGGAPQWMKEWEHDMSLREAMKLSAVPIYQELARRIGLERMRAGVHALGYGNEEIGTQVDLFWLQGPLAISALEQVDFLARLAQGKVPMGAEAIAQVHSITLQKSAPGFELHFKTGWTGSEGPHIGWLVGWIKKEGRISSFALNIDMAAIEDAPKRLEIATDCLAYLGLLEKTP